MAVELTKPSVAGRLLDAAIRSYLRAEDVLATHLIASAAARLLTDLREKRGDDWEHSAFRDGIWYMALEYERGIYSGPPEIKALLKSLVDQIRDGSLVSAEQIELEGRIPEHQLRELRRDLYRTYNFMKHADRDFLLSIAEHDVDPQIPIVIAVGSFAHLFPNVLHVASDLYRYLHQRNQGEGISPDLQPYSRAFEQVDSRELPSVLLAFLEAQDSPIETLGSSPPSGGH